MDDMETSRAAQDSGVSSGSREVVRQFDFEDRKVVVESLSNGPSVIFYPSGRAATPTTITLRSAQEERRQLTISLTGRVSISYGVS